MSSETTVSVVRDGGSVTVAGGGSLDLTIPEYELLHDSLKAAAQEAEALTVDLRRAEFIDMAVVQDLARAAVSMMNRGKRLKVLATQPSHPYRVMQITGFESVMDIEVEPSQDR